MRSALIPSILLALSFASIGKPGLSQGTEEVRNLQRWLGVETDGQIGPQTQRAIERRSQARGLPGDFWSLYNWVVEASSNCRAPIPDGVNVEHVLLEAIEDFPNPEDTRFRNLELGFFTTASLGLRVRMSLDSFFYGEGVLDYTTDDFLNWRREDTISFIRRIVTQDGYFGSICGEINTQNLYGAYTGYEGFSILGGEIFYENGTPYERWIFTSNCQMTTFTRTPISIEDACSDNFLRPENVEAVISEIASSLLSDD